MRYRFNIGAAFIIAVTGLASGQATAEEIYNDVSWVPANGKQCTAVCRASEGRLPVEAAGGNETTVNVCRAKLDSNWATVGYQAKGSCFTIKGDGKTAGLVKTQYDCLCGRL